MKLGRDTVISVAPDVEVRVRADGAVEVALRGTRLVCRGDALAVLAAFRTPTRVEDALSRTAARGAADWIEATVTMQQLFDAGALRDSSQKHEVHIDRVHAFERPSQHIMMLDDEPRTHAFLAALREIVRPTDVVVDIGTGTGVLAIGAARAGARHVYAIEAGASAALARRVVAENGLSDKITIVEGWSTRVELPERATLIVSETIGSDPFDEEILFIMWDASRRLLAEGGRIVPAHLVLHAVLVEVPRDVWAAETYTREAVARWKSAYSIDFDPLLHASIPTRFFADRRVARDWKRLSAPVRLGEVAFDRPPLTLSWEARGHATETSTRVAVLTYFELALSENVRFSQDPLANVIAPDWPCAVWLSPEVTTLERDRAFAITYRRSGTSALFLRPG